MQININDIKNGMTIVMDGNLYVIQEFQHVKPGKGPAFVRIKLKNLRTGSTTEDTFNTNIKIQRAHIDKVNVQFLYSAGDSYTFMNNETYEQFEVDTKTLGENVNFIKEGLDITIDFYEGEIIGITLPEKVEYEVIETEPAVKGNTTNNANKDAKIETGYVVKVPLFITQGEKIIVSTSDGKYSSRA
ncbi:MAG: elongation factor P [Firmicutes bacterium]|nr:elongation factor P [Bacillota bacterium]